MPSVKRCITTRQMRKLNAGSVQGTLLKEYFIKGQQIFITYFQVYGMEMQKSKLNGIPGSAGYPHH